MTGLWYSGTKSMNYAHGVALSQLFDCLGGYDNCSVSEEGLCGVIGIEDSPLSPFLWHSYYRNLVEGIAFDRS
jgi:hypothetical protein